MPQPPTTAGGLMSYPTTVDTGQVAPLMLRNDGDVSTTTLAVTAGAIYFAGVELVAPVTITQMRTAFSGTPTGNVDMGIYDASGTNNGPGILLAHTGAIVAATGLYTQNLTANLALSPGRYWLAVIDTVADSIAGKTGAVAGLTLVLRSTGTANTSLGSVGGSAPAVQSTTLIPQIDGLISGSFS